MNFFKKGFEYNNLAKSFNGLIPLIDQLEMKINFGEVDVISDVFLLTYLCRIEVQDRIEQYNWSFGTPIDIPILEKRVTLMMAYQMTIGKIMKIADEIGRTNDVNDILAKGELFHELDKAIPSHLKKII